MSSPSSPQPLSLFSLALSRRGLLAATAAAVPAGLLLPGGAPAHADPSVRDGETRIRDVKLAETETAVTDRGEAREISDALATMVGVTWDESVDPTHMEARALQEDGAWGPWYGMEPATDPDTGQTVRATEPVWLDVAVRVQIRGDENGRDVTAALTAHLITTSPTSKDYAPAAESGASLQSLSRHEKQLRSADSGHVRTQSRANAATPQLGPGAPQIVSRAAWGADESTVREAATADALRAVVIHHTDGANGYSQASVPQILRGILNYHHRTLGWSDIGYNALVDRFGRIYEGRAGGLHRHVSGAHARGFNTGSFGISVLGSYTHAEPSLAAREAVARLAAWKLLTAFRPEVRGTQQWTAGMSRLKFPKGTTVRLPHLFSHRDVNYTSCPGDAFYRGLDRLRDRTQHFMNTGWRAHWDAFRHAGGERELGTVTHGAYREGACIVTRLTKGLVVTDASRHTTAYPSPFVEQWTAQWGRPMGRPQRDGNRTIQAFSKGVAALEGRAVRFVPQVFRDVDPRRVFFLEIHDLEAKGIIRGWGDSTFRPDNENLRDAMIVFIHRALGAPSLRPPARSPFRDLPTDFVFYRELCWAHQKGIARGWPDKTFRPLIPVKRDAVAAFLHRAAGSPPAQATWAARFRDVPADHVFAAEIGWMAQTGISRGWADGTFRPDAHITRDQMAAFIARWLGVTGRI